MDSNSPEVSPGMQLPAPVEQAAGDLVPENGPAGTLEKGPAAAPEIAPNATAAAAPSVAIPLPVPPNPTASAQQAAVATTTNQVTPTIADDSDLIEKEWVDRAKKIVDSTRDDPYKQSEALTEVKADYLKKRYNKVLKLSK